MRRDGKFGLARTVRRCHAGRCHKNPAAMTKQNEQLRTTFAAWCKAVGSEMRPWPVVQQLDNCTGPQGGHSSSKGRSRTCFGHNFSHIARCSMCRTGNPCKSMKKNQGTRERQQHLDQLHTARIAVGQKASTVDCSCGWAGCTWEGNTFHASDTYLAVSKKDITVGHFAEGNSSHKAQFDRDIVGAYPNSEMLCQVTGPLSMFIKCKKGCLDCPVRKHRQPSVMSVSCAASPLALEDLPPVDDAWYLV